MLRKQIFVEFLLPGTQDKDGKAAALNAAAFRIERDMEVEPTFSPCPSSAVVEQAGDGDRTRVYGLEGRCITTMLLPQTATEGGEG